MRRGVISIPAHARPIRIALHCSKQAGTSHRGMLKSAAANSEAAAGRGGLDGVDEEAGADEDEREQRDAHACEIKQGRSALGQLALRRLLFQRQSMPQAAASFGQPRPISRVGRAGHTGLVFHTGGVPMRRVWCFCSSPDSISTSFWHMADLTPEVSQSRMR